MSSNQALQLLRRWQILGWIRPLDFEFSRFLAEVDASADAKALLAAALTSHQLGRGHICLSISAMLEDPDACLALPAELEGDDEPEALPSRQWAGQSPQEWLTALKRSVDIIGAAAGNTPLVLAGDRLYLRRYWQYEMDVAASIMARVTSESPIPDGLALRLQQLFGAQQTAGGPDWQRIACALAVRKGFTVITGGPGTGKTTTVVRLIALLQSSRSVQPNALHIRLAAPTGKAAARLTESIGKSLAELPHAMQTNIPLEASTLHKLLGARPGTRHLVHNESNPLHADVVVVDEASMIDLEMMASLLKALRPDTRLILLGDKDQLASVEAGSVLGDLCRHADLPGYRAETVAWLETVIGQSLTAFRGEQGQLDQQIAMLRVSHRFDAHSGIGQLAATVKAGAIDKVTAVLQRQPAYADIRHIIVESSEDQRLDDLYVNGWQSLTHDLDLAAVGYRHYLRVLSEQRPTADAGSDAYLTWADEVLRAFDRFQLLCAVRQGGWGVERLNLHIAELLYRQGLIAQSHGWYEGRPVLVTRNDYGLGLMNGDIGIALKIPEADSGEMRLRVVFAQADGRIKLVLPSRLTDVETVYAMTVHKSQGSEFQHVALLLPDQSSPVLTRELIYTGITRAKQWFTLLSSNQTVLQQAVVSQVKRAGGLSELLR